MNHFIVEFKNALSPEFCVSVVDKFSNSTQQHAGRTGSGVDKTKKNSIDLAISQLPQWRDEVEQLNQTIFQAFLQYTKAYPHIVCGAISSRLQDPKTGEIKELHGQDIQKMTPQQLAPIAAQIYQIEPLNMQKYLKREGGYPHWHSEHFPHPTDQAQRSLHRVLLVLIYLNDIEEAGETEFLYQNLKIKPTQGSIVLAPCGFTHTHCGHPAPQNDKYVLASWIGFRPAQELYR